MRPVRPGKTGLWSAVGEQRNACARTHEPETVCVFDEGGMSMTREQAIKQLESLRRSNDGRGRTDGDGEIGGSTQ